MLGGGFVEELKKNKVLSNKSNKFASIYFSMFKGRKELTLYGSNYLNYGYIKLETKSAVILKVYYKDILISCITGDKSVFVPIAIENNSKIIIEGESEELKVYVLGAKFYNKNCDYLIPVKNYKIQSLGHDFVRKYNDKDDFEKGVFTNVFEYEKLYSSQVFKMSDMIYHGNLVENDGLYLYTDINNYTTPIWIEDDVKGAMIMSSDLDKGYIIYIKGGKLLYKTLNKDLELSDSLEISKNVNYMPIGFCPIEMYDFNYNLVVVKWNNGTSSVFRFLDDKFVNIFTFKGDNLKLQLFSNHVNLVKFNDYGISVIKYIVSDGGVTLNDTNNEYKLNVNDYYFIDNSGLYFHNENCTEITK